MMNPTPTESEVEKKFQNGWTKEVEQLMAEWADKAACYRWMHEKTERAFNKYNQYFTIPVIILSTLTGTANFGLDSMVPDAGAQKIAMAVIGGVGLLTGIISTIANFLRYAQGSEANRGAALSWGKFQRLIAIELSLNPDERSDCMHFLKLCRTELDRLIEQSPPIPNDIIEAFKKEFKSYPLVRKPEIAGEILHTNVFDGSDERLVRMAADSALMVQTRQGVVKQLVMEDIEARIAALVAATIKAKQGPIGPVKSTSLEVGLADRKKEIEKIAMGGVVRAMKEKLMTANMTIGPTPAGMGGGLSPETSETSETVESDKIEIQVGDLPGVIEERDEHEEPPGKS